MDKKNETPLENLDFLNGHENLLSHINAPEEETDSTQSTTESAPRVKPNFSPKKEATGKPKKIKQPEKTERERTSQEEKRHQELIKHQALEEAEVKEFLNLIIKYAKPALITILIICAFFLTQSVFKNNRVRKESRADTALMQANTATDLQAVIDNFGTTSSAPLAIMELAQKEFNASKIQEADALYKNFLKKYPKHAMAPQAQLNQITCLEANGKYQEASTQFGKFAKDNASSSLAPVALISQARCLTNISKFDEAKQTYEDLIVSYPQTSWAQEAEFKIKTLQAKLN